MISQPQYLIIGVIDTSLQIVLRPCMKSWCSCGHGIPEATIKKWYPQSNRNLAAVAAKADNVFIFDNTNRFMLVYVSEQAKRLRIHCGNFLGLIRVSRLK